MRIHIEMLRKKLSGFGADNTTETVNINTDKP
jgi:hypothetical protein